MGPAASRIPGSLPGQVPFMSLLLHHCCIRASLFGSCRAPAQCRARLLATIPTSQPHTMFQMHCRFHGLALGFQAVLILYVLDPFAGSASLCLSGFRLPTGSPDPEMSGLLGAINGLWDPQGGSEVCTNTFLGYFTREPALLDRRLDNPAVQHFGYCSRGCVSRLPSPALCSSYPSANPTPKPQQFETLCLELNGCWGASQRCCLFVGVQTLRFGGHVWCAGIGHTCGLLSLG